MLGILQRSSYKSESVGTKPVAHISVQRHWIYRVVLQDDFTVFGRDRGCYPHLLFQRSSLGSSFQGKRKEQLQNCPGEGKQNGLQPLVHANSPTRTVPDVHPDHRALGHCPCLRNLIKQNCRRLQKVPQGGQRKTGTLSSNTDKTTWELLWVCSPPGRGEI